MNDQEEQERGARLTAFAKHRYGSVRRMSIDCGIHENSLRRYCAGERPVSAEVLAVVIRDGGSADWILTGKGTMVADNSDVDMIPITVKDLRDLLRQSIERGRSPLKDSTPLDVAPVDYRIQHAAAYHRMASEAKADLSPPTRRPVGKGRRCCCRGNRTAAIKKQRGLFAPVALHSRSHCIPRSDCSASY